MNKFNRLFNSAKEYAPLPLRIIAAWRLLAGVWDYAFGVKPMSEVAGFFASLGIPAPSVSAAVAVYAQLLCAICFLIGLFVRPAALILIINFTVAILAAHMADPIVKSFAAWALLAISVSLLLSGGGKLSLDNRLGRRNNYVPAS